MADEGGQNNFFMLNGKEINIEDLFTRGVHVTINDMRESRYDYQEEVEEVSDEEEPPSEIDATMKDNFQTIKNEVSLQTMMEERPASIEALWREMTTNVTEDGLVRKKVLEEGGGAVIPSDSKIWFHLVGFCNDSKKCFDSTFERNRVDSIRLEPPGEVIKGLRLALKTMRVFETSQILIHYLYGFGEQGVFGRIAKKATLIYNVKLIAYLPRDKFTVLHMNRAERAIQPFSEIFKFGTEVRSQGNHNFASGDYRAAIRCYRRGIDLLEDFSVPAQQEDNKRSEFLSDAYLNLAKAYLRTDLPYRGGPASVACKKGLELKKKSNKASFLFTFAQAKLICESFDDALSLVKKARAKGKSEAKCNDLEKKILAERGNK